MQVVRTRLVVVAVWLCVVCWARDSKYRVEILPGHPSSDVSSPSYPSFMPRGNHVITVVTVPGAFITITCPRITQVDGSCDSSMLYLMISNGSVVDTVCGSRTSFTAKVDDATLQLKMAAFSADQLRAECHATASLEGRNMPDYLLDGFDDQDVGSREQGDKDRPASKSTSCPCGWANKKKSRGRIVGGSETAPGEYPWAAVIIERIVSIGDLYHFCTGSVLTVRHVLTAGHCLKDYVAGWRTGDRAHLAVIVGAHHVYNDKDIEGRQEVRVVDMRLHERFLEARDTHYDVAVLTTERILFSDRVGPVCLPDQPLPLLGRLVKAVGWGQTGKLEDLSPVPKKTWLKVLPLETCQPIYEAYNVVRVQEPRQLCMFAPNRGICMGDSGGPVVWWDPQSNRYVQVGVSTHSLQCSSFFPDVALDLTKTLPWIRAAINDPSVQTCHRLP